MATDTAPLPTYQGQLVNGYAPVPGYSNSNPGLSTTGTPLAGINNTPASSPVTILTSNQSRSNYANNVSTMNTALGSIPVPAYGSDVKDASGKVVGQAKYDPNTGKPLTPPNGGQANTSGVKSNTYNADGSVDVEYNDGTKATIPAGGDTSGVQNPDGSTGAPDGSTGTGTGLDPAIKSQYDSALTALDQNIADAKATLDQAKATLANDPAAQAAVDAVAAKYDVLISAMKAKNQIVLGSYKTNAARSGSLQFANEMNTSFMSEEMDKASQRVSDLVTQEQSLILKTQQAYKTGDLKALNEATTAYEKANTDKISALNKLLTATNAQVKTVQAQAKIEAAATKDAIANDTKLSTGLAQSIADNIASSGITDPAQIQSYIQGMATKAGISNPDILKSAVTKAQQTTAKFNTSQENTASIIKKRNSTKTGGTKATGGGTDGGYTYTGDDVATYTSLLNKGGTGPDGTVYAKRGADGFVDPAAYIAAYKDWVDNNGGTPAGFVKKFPVAKNINPASISKLPAALTAK